MNNKSGAVEPCPNWGEGEPSRGRETHQGGTSLLVVREQQLECLVVNDPVGLAKLLGDAGRSLVKGGERKGVGSHCFFENSAFDTS